MDDATPEVGAERFRIARLADRRLRQEQRDGERAHAVADLHRARDAFDEIDPAAAARDGDALEAMADRVVDWVRTLERDFERLEIARDRIHERGAVRIRRAAPFDCAAIGMGVAETLAEALLSAEAAAVLVAAVRRSAL